MVLLLFAAGALAIIGMAGLALDLGMAYLNKTRLQNAVDAAALDGAKGLQNGLSVTTATASALARLNANMTLPSGVTPVIETSNTGAPFVAGTTPAYFVRVTVTNMPVTTYLVNAMGLGAAVQIDGVALAGPQALSGPICGVLPIALCGDPASTDKDCSDGSCYGVTPGPTGEIELKDDVSSGPGNYGLVQLSCGSGVNCVRQAMAGGEDSCFDSDPGSTIETQTGTAPGPVAAGLNMRFGLPGPPLSADDYPSDVVTLTVVGPLGLYTNYETAIRNGAWDRPNGVPKRRVSAVPVIDCTSLGGHTTADVIGSACVFLSRPAVGPPIQTVYSQLIGTCTAEGGTPAPPGSGGPERIILYPASADS